MDILYPEQFFTEIYNKVTESSNFFYRTPIWIVLYLILSEVAYFGTGHSLPYQRSYIFLNYWRLKGINALERCENVALDLQLLFNEIEFVRLEPKLARGYSTFFTKKWRNPGSEPAAMLGPRSANPCHGDVPRTVAKSSARPSDQFPRGVPGLCVKLPRALEEAGREASGCYLAGYKTLLVEFRNGLDDHGGTQASALRCFSSLLLMPSAA